MKKKLITALMLSTVILSSGASLGAVKADSTDDQIAKQDAAISAAKSSSAEAQAKVDAIQSQVNSLQVIHWVEQCLFTKYGHSINSPFMVIGCLNLWQQPIVTLSLQFLFPIHTSSLKSQ